ncbi:MAG: DUF4382 domain-containing protein [Gammaproteobacteria bacterium]|nr:DUF4382 domain-containing protein [Gammaproteobacteria bacterium]
MMRYKIAFCAIALALSGCGNETPAKGTLTLAVTDAPVDSAQRVVVFFASVEIKPANGQAFTVDVSNQIDLLALAGGGSEIILHEVELDAGHYNWIRLEVNAEATMMDSFIELDDGSIHSLFIPSGDQNGLKLIGGFDVPAGGNASFTLDFDLRKSVHNPIGLLPDYILRPTVKMIDTGVNGDPVGGIGGMVSSNLIFDELCTGTSGDAVYVFSGPNSPIDDVDGIAPDPIDSAVVTMDTFGYFVYLIDNLPIGVYTVAFTCDAQFDDPATDDDITFLGGTFNVTVEEGIIKEQNFEQ